MKKDFVLLVKFGQCTKTDRKKVIKLAKSVGYEYKDRDRFNSGSFSNLCFYEKSDRIMYNNRSCVDLEYQMPQDWSLIQEALGIKVEPKLNGINMSIIIKDDFTDLHNFSLPKSRELKEITQLKERIKELESNDKQIRIYLENLEWKHKDLNESYWKLDKENKKLTERITDLEGENLGYKKLLEKRDKEIERLAELNKWQGEKIGEIEDNNGKLFEMANTARKENRELKKQLLKL